jgi:hypothetical protein
MVFPRYHPICPGIRPFSLSGEIPRSGSPLLLRVKPELRYCLLPGPLNHQQPFPGNWLPRITPGRRPRLPDPAPGQLERELRLVSTGRGSQFAPHAALSVSSSVLSSVTAVSCILFAQLSLKLCDCQDNSQITGKLPAIDPSAGCSTPDLRFTGNLREEIQ